MFKEAEGPTALRLELVRALSLSMGTAALETDAGEEPCCAGLVGVWNGKKGFVAVLVRHLGQPRIQRFVFGEPLKNSETVTQAVDAALAFAESLGFSMDACEFEALGATEKARRLELWNDLRKLSRKPPVEVRGESPVPAAEPNGPKRIDAPAEADVEDDGAVLGRLSLVRKTEGDEDYIDPRARLLSYF